MRPRNLAVAVFFALFFTSPALLNASRVRDLPSSQNGMNQCPGSGSQSCLCPSSQATPFLAQLDGTQSPPRSCTPGSDQNQPNPPFPYPNRVVTLIGAGDSFTATITPVLWQSAGGGKETIFQVSFQTSHSNWSLRSLIIGTALANPTYVDCQGPQDGSYPYCTSTPYQDPNDSNCPNGPPCPTALEPTGVTFADYTSTRWDFYQLVPNTSVDVAVEGFPAEFADIDNLPNSNGLTLAALSSSNFLAIVQDQTGHTVATAGGLSLSSAPAATNDVCNTQTCNAVPITALPFHSFVDTSNTYPQENLSDGSEMNPQGDPIPPCASRSAVFRTVWYTYTASQNEMLTISTRGSRYDTLVYVFTGSPGSPTTVACNDDFTPGVVQSYVTFPAPAGLIYIMVSESAPDLLVQQGGIGAEPLANDATLVLDVTSAATASALQFVPVPPCRVLYTPNGQPIPGGTQVNFAIPQGGNCNLPVATAYSLNATVIPHGSLGYLTLWPTGQPQPVVSLLNSPDGRVKANAAIVSARPSDGSISIYATNTTDLILDVNGYFAPPSSSTLAFYPLPTCRVVDTRNLDGQLGGPYLQGRLTRDFPVLASSCFPSGVNPRAYSFNMTAVPHQGLGFLTVWPYGTPMPGSSTLNSNSGVTTANAAIVQAGTGGDINVFVSDDSDLVIDVNGYFATHTSSGLSLYPVTPCRILDTRRTNGGNGSFSGVLEPPPDLAESRCDLLDTAQAFVLNASVLPAGSLGFLTLWTDGTLQPMASILNAPDGAPTSNMAIAYSPFDGFADVYAAGTTDLLLDISAYFAP